MANKRRRINVALIIVAVVILSCSLIACNHNNNNSGPVVSDEIVGKYYFDAVDGVFYSIDLKKDGTASFKVNDKNLTGNFAANNNKITLTLSDDSVADITYTNDTLNVKYKNEEMTFLRDIDYTVSFDSKGGSAIEAITVKNGRLAVLPTNPTRTQYAFIGWYSDEQCTSAFNFNTEKITKNIKVYAKWEYVNIVNTLTYKNDDLVKTVNAQANVTESENYVLEAPSFTEYGHIFLGWYTEDGVQLTDEEGKSLVEWDPILGNITIVAKHRINYTYEELSDGSYKVSGNKYTAVMNYIDIPSNYNGAQISEIGKFEGHSKVTSAKLPANIAFIEETAFMESPLLASFDVNSEGITKATVKAVDGVLFDAKLTELKLYPIAKENTSYVVPSTVVKIGPRAFYEIAIDGTFTGKLTSVKMPKNLTTIGAYAFYERGNLKTVLFDESATVALTIEDSAFKYVPLAEYDAATETGFKLPKNIVSIGDSAFQADKTKWGLIPTFSKTLDLPEGLKHIGANAFNTHANTTYIKIPASVETIGAYAFANKMFGAITVEFAEGSKLTELSDGVFFKNPMTTITLPSSLKKIGYGVFDLGPYGSTGLQKLVIPEGVTTIADGAFKGMKALEDITIPASVTYLGSNAFDGCSKLTLEKIHFAKDSNLGKIYEGVLYSSDMTQIILIPSNFAKPEYVMPDTVTTAPSGLFMHNAITTKVTLSKNLKAISGSMFESSAITEIVIPASVERIDNRAFASAVYNELTALRKITFEQNSKLNFIGEHAFDGSGITEIELPDSVRTVAHEAFSRTEIVNFVFNDNIETIGDNVFAGSPKVATVKLPKNLKSKGKNSLNAKALTSITIDPSNQVYKTVDGVLFSKDGKKLVMFPMNKATEYTVPDGVEEIGDYAFEENTKIQNVVLPDSARIIGDHSFIRATGLKTINLNNITVIKDWSFTECNSLDSITLSTELKEIPMYAFYHTAIKTLDTKNVEVLGDSAFRGCLNLANIKIGKGLKELNVLAFDGDARIEEFVVDEENANFKAVDGSLYSKDGKVLYRYALARPDLTFVIGDEVERICQNAFTYEQSRFKVALKNIVLGKNLKELDSYSIQSFWNAFQGYYNLDSIAINNQAIVDYQLFENENICSGVNTIKFNKDLTIPTEKLEAAGYVKQADDTEGYIVYAKPAK